MLAASPVNRGVRPAGVAANGLNPLRKEPTDEYDERNEDEQMYNRSRDRKVAKQKPECIVIKGAV